MSNTATMENTVVKNPVAEEKPAKEPRKKKHFSDYFSVPLLKQSIKANWVLWLILAIGSALIFIIINAASGTKKVFTAIDMNVVTQYVADENMNWLQILGLLDIMGFQLSRIQVMSQLDLNSIMSDLINKIAGVLLPMIYVMIVGNRLIASQVSEGSMAYVLSTPTARKKVVRTQFLFLSVSLVLMYVIVFIGQFVSGMPAAIKLAITPFSTYTLKTLLSCFASFTAIFFLMGVCFGASAFFNKSSKSIAVGGGACVIAFLCCILGLFANNVFVAVGVGVEEMQFFNYLTVFTLIDTDSITNFCKGATGVIDSNMMSFDWIWKCAISIGCGLGLSFLGGLIFTKKDLPL